MQRRIGYARVSSCDQNLSLQMDALQRAGCDQIFHDHGYSGVVRGRPALEQALAALKPGDVLVTWKLDRLGRSLAHLIEIIGELADRGIDFHSLSEAIDTTTAGGKLLFHVIGAIAEFERTLISERTRAGMASARIRGVHVGRPVKLASEIVMDMRKKIEGGLPVADAARLYNVSRLTLERALKRLAAAA